MRQFNRFCAVTLLSLAIGTSAFAGDVQAPASPNPPPPAPLPPVTCPAGEVCTQPDASTIITTLTLELYLQLISGL